MVTTIFMQEGSYANLGSYNALNPASFTSCRFAITVSKREPLPRSGLVQSHFANRKKTTPRPCFSCNLSTLSSSAFKRRCWLTAIFHGGLRKVQEFSGLAGIATRRAARHVADHPLATAAVAGNMLVRGALYLGGCERHEIDLASLSVLFAKVTLRQSRQALAQRLSRFSKGYNAGE